MIDGKKIKYYRELLGISQKALGEKLDVSQSLIAHWERGYKIPVTYQLMLLADTLGVKMDDFRAS